MRLRVPVTASNIAEWVRVAATAINSLLSGSEANETRVAALEVGAATAVSDIAAIDTRVDALEAASGVALAHPFVQLAAAPGSPSAGQSYYDTVLLKVRTWDGTAWQAHW